MPIEDYIGVQPDAPYGIGWHYMDTAPKDGTVILALFAPTGANGTNVQRLIRWVDTPYYNGWDTGALIQPWFWKEVSREECDGGRPPTPSRSATGQTR